MTTRVRYPMPCPRCRRIVDARERRCPHCGADTDAILAPARAIVPVAVVGVMLVLVAVFRAGAFWVALLGGLLAGMVFRRSRLQQALRRGSNGEVR